MIVAVTTILQPLDITIWALQSKLSNHRPSADIVLVEVDATPASVADGSQNAMLGNLLREIDRSGARDIFVDVPLHKSMSPRDDADLKRDLNALAGRVTLAQAVDTDSNRDAEEMRSDPFFTNGLDIVSSDFEPDFLGFAWHLTPTRELAGEQVPTLWHALVERSGRDTTVYPDYTINPAGIPRIDAQAYLANTASDRPELAGKAVVVGMIGQAATTVRIPGQGEEPSTLLHIIAAETAMQKSGHLWDWFLMTGTFALGLLLCLIAGRADSHRRALYVLWCLALPAGVFVAASFGDRAFFSGPVFLACAYAAMRATVNYKRRHLFIEPRSKLPNFDALRRDLADREIGDSDLVVVAKVARLDAVFATLTPSEQGLYLRQLASRLALGNSEASVHYDGGKYFAFVLAKADYADVQGHLEGLRAIASQSITLSDRILDVSITIGVDASGEKSLSKRLSSAIAAADQAREAYRPVFIISELVGDTEGWDYSLQARLETALSEDRIGINLQPQVDLRTGEIVGIEALARWVDDEEGYIAPSRFILQCERVGRLDDLTKRVLMKSLSASSALRSRGFTPSIAINVSAIQFVDDRFTNMLERILATNNVDPSMLKIEVTESARIEDYGTARELMERIKRNGIALSVDDFGVESANLEAIYELPFDEIKIDRKFVSELSRSKTARAIVENVIRMARDAEMISLAEGIETRESFELLRAMGCDLGQGYHIARPLALAELMQTLELQGNIPLLNRGFG